MKVVNYFINNTKLILISTSLIVVLACWANFWLDLIKYVFLGVNYGADYILTEIIYFVISFGFCLPFLSMIRLKDDALDPLDRKRVFVYRSVLTIVILIYSIIKHNTDNSYLLQLPVLGIVIVFVIHLFIYTLADIKAKKQISKIRIKDRIEFFGSLSDEKLRDEYIRLEKALRKSEQKVLYDLDSPLSAIKEVKRTLKDLELIKYELNKRSPAITNDMTPERFYLSLLNDFDLENEQYFAYHQNQTIEEMKRKKPFYAYLDEIYFHNSIRISMTYQEMEKRRKANLSKDTKDEQIISIKKKEEMI